MTKKYKKIVLGFETKKTNYKGISIPFIKVHELSNF